MPLLTSFRVSQYVATRSLLHELDARTKILAASLIVACALLVGEPAAYIVLALLLAAATVAGRLPWRLVWQTYRFIFLALLVGAAITAIIYPGPILIHLVGPAAITRPGLTYGLRLLGQLGLLAYTTGLLTMTTPPLTLTDGLQRLFGWLSRLRVPVEEIALIITLGLTFLPLIQQQLDRVLTAQLARGADFRGGTWEMRGRNALALLLPLLVSNLRRAEDLALAMEARGYHVGERRTHLQVQTMGWRDYLVLALVAAVTAVTYLIWRG
jgi:energy-coupling factor transport system permease protein